MIKKFTLLLVLAFVAVGANAQQRVVYLGDFDIFWSGADTYKITQQSLTIPAGAFTDIKTGDYLEVIGLPIEELIKKADDSVKKNYNYQVKLCGWDKSNSDAWRDISGTYSVNTDPTYYQLTADDVEDIKASGLVIQGYGFTIKRVAVGSQPAFSATSNDITCENDYSYYIGNWDKNSKITTDLTSLKVGDKITINFTCDGGWTHDYDRQVRLADQTEPGWKTLYAAAVGGKTTVSFIMTEAVIKSFRAGHTISVGGCFVTITSITYTSRTSGLTYSLFDSIDGMTNFAYIPNGSDYTLYRSIPADKWATIVLPFDMTNPQIKTAFGENVSVAQLSDESTADELKFTGVTTMTANQPYAIKVASGDSYSGTATIENVNIVSATPTQSTTKWYFVGTYTSGNIPEESYFFQDNKLYYASGSSNHIKPFRAYFRPVVSGVRGFVGFSVDGQTTGIHSTLYDSTNKGDGKIYSLSGQIVTAPQKGVVYIVDGKKVIFNK